MKSFLAAVLWMILGCTLVAAQDKAQSRVVKVGVFSIDPIVSVSPGGEPRGFFVDLINDIADQENWRLVYVPGTWNEGLERLENGRIDLMTAVAYTEERQNRMQFSQETVLTVWGQVYAKLGHDYQTILDLKGKRVALAQGDINGLNYQENARKFGVDCDYRIVATHEDIFRYIQSGEVDVGVVPNIYGMTHAGDFGIVGTAVIFNPVESRFAAPKGSDGSLLKTIDAHMAAWKQEEDSFYYRSLNKWLGVRSVDGKTVPAWVLEAGTVAVLLALVLFLWNRILERKIKARTRELYASETKQRIIFDQSFQFIGLLNPEGYLLDVNQTALDFIGVPAKDVIGRPFWEAPWWSHSAAAQEDLRRGIQLVAEGGIFKSEATHPAADGSLHYVEFSIKGIKDESGKVKWLVPEGRDITEQKVIQEQLTRLAQVVEQSTEMVIITDVDGIIEYVNPAFVEMTGFGADEAAGRRLQFLCPEDQDGYLYSRSWFEMLAGQSWHSRTTNMKRDGSSFEVDTMVSPILDEKGGVLSYVVLQRDMTRLEDLERNLRQAQRLEAVGTLAAGIAHDFNNILAAVFGYTELAQLALSEDSPAREYLDEVIVGAERARALVSQILVFGRRSEHEWQEMALGEIVHEVSDLLRATMPATIKVEEDLAEDGFILGDQGQMHQVMMNLCTNAFHAMEDRGGVLKISLTKETVESLDEKIKNQLPPGHYLVLVVEDNGPGMDPQLLEKIFEPYFTTKEPGKGTGLGLAVVHGIIQAHHGTIKIDSRPGKGTKVKILLPELTVQSDSGDAVIVAKSQEGRGEHILFVDDEDVLGRLVELYFTGLGYKVSSFTDSREAWTAFREAPGDFDILISDQSMPGMTGIDLASQAFALRPEIPYILCTGYSADISRESAEALGIDRFVQKPVEMEKLGSIVRELLDQGPNQPG